MNGKFLIGTKNSNLPGINITKDMEVSCPEQYIALPASV